MEQGERALYMVPTRDYSGYMLFFFASGKIAKVNLSAYQTKQNRRKLVGAYSDKSPLVAVYWEMCIRDRYVGYPDIKGREEVLKVHARGKPLGPDVDLGVIAKTTAGFRSEERRVGKECASMCRSRWSPYH